MTAANVASWVRSWPLSDSWLQGCALGAVGIGLATAVLVPTARLLGEGDTALLYMPVVIGIAAVGGVRAGVVSSLMGFVVAKFFFVPTYYSLYFQDPRDWVSLFVFVLVGLGMGVQTTRMQRRSVELAARERERAMAAGLLEADRLKSNLVSSVSHELKTPLAIVTAIVTNLLEADLELTVDGMRADLRTAADALWRLNASIGDLLALSRLESGSWEPRREWCDMNEIVEAVREKIPLPQRDRLHIEAPSDLPMVLVDDVQWVRVLGHVVENALSYAPPGAPVVLRVQVVDGEMRTLVEDEGPGVAPAEAARIFDKFYRGAAASTVPSGTGLGLAISRDIVEFHEGRIWVEPRQPHGARFVIALPLGEQPAVRVE